MARYIINETTNGKIVFPSIAVSPTVGNYIEFKAAATGIASNGNMIQIGQAGAWTSSIVLANERARVNSGTSRNFEIGEGYYSPNLNTPVVVRLAYTAEGWEFSIDGYSYPKWSDANTFNLDYFFERHDIDSSIPGIFYYLETGDSTGTTDRWDAEDATGSTVPNSINVGADATLSEFPTDGTQFGNDPNPTDLTDKALAIDFSRGNGGFIIPTLPTSIKTMEGEFVSTLQTVGDFNRILNVNGFSVYLSDGSANGLGYSYIRNFSDLGYASPRAFNDTVATGKHKIEFGVVPSSLDSSKIETYIRLNDTDLHRNNTNTDLTSAVNPEPDITVGRSKNFSYLGTMDYLKLRVTDFNDVVYELELRNLGNTNAENWIDVSGNGHHGVRYGVLHSQDRWIPYDYTPPQIPNELPTANAGINITVIEGNEFQLSGSGVDTDGTIASFAWTQTAGTPTALSSTTAANPTGTRAITGTGETLTYQLTVTDNDGDSSVADTVNVVVTAANVNQAPTVVTNGNQTNIGTGDTVTLSAVGSTDDDTISSYLWEQTSGNPTVTLINPNTATATYTAPDLQTAVTLTFRATVTDNDGATSSQQVNHAISANTVVVDLDLSTAPLVQDITLDYMGSFFARGTGFEQGIMCVSEDGNSFFTSDGSNFKQYTLPNNLDRESGYPNGKEIATSLQESGEIFGSDRVELKITERFRVTALAHVGGKLIVNYADWYDNSATPQTTFVFRDASNLATSAIDGPFGLEDAIKQGGIITKVPANLQNFFGGDLLGTSAHLSIDGRLDRGPSIRATDSNDFIESSVTAANFIQLSGPSYMRYPNETDGSVLKWFHNIQELSSVTSGFTKSEIVYDNVLASLPDGSIADEHYWNSNSNAQCAFVIPNSKTLCVVASMSGVTAQPYYSDASVLPTNVPAGIGYKIQTWSYNSETNEYELSTAPTAGGSRYIIDDAYHRFYLFDLSDLEEVKNGTKDPWEIQPYLYKDFKSPFITGRASNPLHFLPTRGHFDINANVLYLSYAEEGGNAQYDQSPLWAAYDVNGLADRTRLTGSNAIPNRAPTVSILGASNGTVGTGLQLSILTSDPDGDSVTVSWTVTNGTLSASNIDNPILNASEPNEVDVTVTVSDGALSAQATRRIVFTNPQVDTTTPVLTANPAATNYSLTVGDSFTPPVVSWTDNGVTDTVATPTPVRTTNGAGDAVDTYTYNYSDAAGNSATPLTITVTYTPSLIPRRTIDATDWFIHPNSPRSDGDYTDGPRASAVSAISMSLSLTTAGRLGFFIDYSELETVGTHNFYVTRTHGSQGAVGCTWTAYDSADGAQLATGSLSWANHSLDVLSFQVPVTSKPAGDHRVYVLLSNPTGGAALHHGEHTVAYGIIDDDTIATSNAIFIDADAATNGTGTQASPYNNWYSARDAVLTTTRYIYIKGLMIPDDTDDILLSTAVKHLAMRGTFEGRNSEAQRLIIRSWPNFVGGVDGGGQTDVMGFGCDGGASSTGTVRYITLRKLSGTNLNTSSGTEASGWVSFLRTRSSASDVIEHWTTENILVDNIVSGGNSISSAWFSETGSHFKLWRWTFRNSSLVNRADGVVHLFQGYDTDNVSVQRCSMTSNVGGIYEKEGSRQGAFKVGVSARFNHFDGSFYTVSTQGGSQIMDYHICQNNIFSNTLNITHSTPVSFRQSSTLTFGSKQVVSNNIFYNYDYSGYAALTVLHEGFDGLLIYNNIFYETTNAWRFSTGVSPAEFIDYNYYQNSALSNEPTFYYFGPDGIPTLSGLQENTSFEENAKTGATLFNDAQNADFTLNVNSDAITGGISNTPVGVYNASFFQVGV